MAKSKKKKPSKAEVAKLRKEVNAITKAFFEKHGGDGGINFLLVGPPGPRPPPKLELDILDLSAKD